MLRQHSSVRVPLLQIVLLALTASIYGCRMDAHESALAAESSAKLSDFLEWSDELALEENEEVINVTPRITIDPLGGFLVADAQESQFRLYGGDGELIGFFGSRGDGPGEFRYAAAAVRMSDGSILAFDGSRGRAARFDADGQTLLETLKTPFASVFDVDVLKDHLLLVAGRTEEDLWNRLHIWDASSSSLIKSFFPAPVDKKNRGAALQAGFAVATVQHDTIAAVFALSDTVYLFRTDGSAIGQLPIPSRYFRPLEEAPPRGGRGGIAAVRDWLASFSMVSGVFWGPDATFVVQYQDRENMLPKWRLLQMTRDGRRVFELVDTPELLASAESEASFYFIKPGSEAPNRWAIGRLRRPS